MRKADGRCQVIDRNGLPDNLEVNLNGKIWPSAYFGTVLLAFHDGSCPVISIAGFMGPRLVNNEKVNQLS
jgi:hypothetical protein